MLEVHCYNTGQYKLKHRDRPVCRRLLVGWISPLSLWVLLSWFALWVLGMRAGCEDSGVVMV